MKKLLLVDVPDGSGDVRSVNYLNQHGFMDVASVKELNLPTEGEKVEMEKEYVKASRGVHYEEPDRGLHFMRGMSAIINKLLNQ